MRYSIAMKAVVLLPAAAKALRKHRAEAERILGKIEAYAADPASQGANIKALSGSRRSGCGSEIFVWSSRETETEMVVTKIGPRGSVYD